MSGSWGSWQDMNARNVSRLKAAEKKAPIDFALYGDSITSFHFGYTISSKHPGSDKVWKKHFGSLNAVPLAIPGDQIGQVAWRLSKGGEKPSRDPKVIGFLIGVNDCSRFGEDRTKPRSPPTEERMDYLLQLVKEMCPSSAVLLCALTPVMQPTILTARKELNASYKNLADKYGSLGMRIRYVDCSASITKSDGTPSADGYLSDYVHLTENGHEVVLKNMRRAVDDLLKANSSSSTPSSPLESKKSLIVAGVALCFVCCMSLCFVLLLTQMM